MIDDDAIELKKIGSNDVWASWSLTAVMIAGLSLFSVIVQFRSEREALAFDDRMTVLVAQALTSKPAVSSSVRPSAQPGAQHAR